MGIVLCARLAGDPARAARACARWPRPRRRRSAPAWRCRSRAARSSPRSSGWRCCCAMAPGGVQLRAVLLVAAAAALAGLLAALLPAVHDVSGPLGRARVAGRGAARRRSCSSRSPQRRPARRLAAAGAAERLRGVRPAAVVAGLVVAVALVAGAARGRGRAGAHRRGRDAGASRQHRLQPLLATGASRWRASRTPRCAGTAAGSFGTLWLRERTIPEVVRDAHSLELETAAELGLVGLLLLGAFLGGVAACAARARGRRRERWRARWPRSRSGAPTARSTGTGRCRRASTLSAILLAGLVIALAEPDGRRFRATRRARTGAGAPPPRAARRRAEPPPAP